MGLAGGRWWLGAAACVAMAGATAASAGVLEIVPILADVVTMADGATVVTLHNRATTPATVQVRLLRWHNADGHEVLEPTADAGASPPFATIAPGAVHVVRVVRFAKRPVQGEEAYRLLLDELPAAGQTPGTIALTVRHALPVFFRTPTARPAQVTWRVVPAAGGQELVATNAGERRLRVSELKLADASGHVVDFGNGLAGYVLGSQQQQWRLPAATPLAGPVRVSFRSEDGAEQEQAPVGGQAGPRQRI